MGRDDDDGVVVGAAPPRPRPKMPKKDDDEDEDDDAPEVEAVASVALSVAPPRSLPETAGRWNRNAGSEGDEEEAMEVFEKKTARDKVSG